MPPSQPAVPEVPLKTFVARQWWALAAGLAGVVVAGAFAIGVYTLPVLLLGVWFYGSAALLLVVGRPLLLRRPDELIASRKRRMARVLAMTGIACVLALAAVLTWFYGVPVLSGDGMPRIHAQDLAWVAAPPLAVAAVHVLSAWMFEWLGGHTAAKRLGVPS